MMNTKEKIKYITILATHSIAFLGVMIILGILITNVFILMISLLVLFPIVMISAFRVTSYFLSDYIDRFWAEKEEHKER